MTGVVRAIGDLPIIARFAVVGALVLGLPGAVTGLTMGIIAYPPTAWFALLELGVPAAMLGAVLGLLVSTVTIRRLVRSHDAA